MGFFKCGGKEILSPAPDGECGGCLASAALTSGLVAAGPVGALHILSRKFLVGSLCLQHDTPFLALEGSWSMWNRLLFPI